MTVAHPPGGGRGANPAPEPADAGTTGGGGGSGHDEGQQPRQTSPAPGQPGQPRTFSPPGVPAPSSSSSSAAPAVGRVPSTATTETSSSPSDLSSPTPPTEKTNDDAPGAALTPPPSSIADESPQPSAEDLLATYPVAKLNKLEELISNPRWVIPVLPGAELEVLLETSIVLARAGLDVRSDACMRFYREGLLVSFTKIMTDEAVSSWRQDIHKYILKNCERLMELCALKMGDDWFPQLDLLGLVLNPGNKFHLYNASRPSESLHLESRLERLSLQQQHQGEGSEEAKHKVFAQSVDVRQPKGWLVDLVNKFGQLGGFDKMLERFVGEDGQVTSNLTVPLIHALVKPFGQCCEILTQSTVTTYLLPVVEVVPQFLESMSEEDLKKETKGESKNDALATIVKSLKSIAATLPGQEESVRQLEMFRLKMILRQLQVSSFGGKMSALNEVNRVISSVSYYSPQQRNHPSGNTSSTAATTGNIAGGGGGGAEDEDFLTAERMALWLKENKVLQIVLQDSLHQPQYVEKLEKVIRFLIKEHTLTLSDLDDIWAAQVGQHEAIVKNVHDLLAKLAWDFSPEQLDHLFECFQRSWNTAPPKQREKLLELIRRLAEDDKDGVMAEKVLTLFWNLAHNPDTSTELMDQALAAHIKILDYSCTQYRDSQKSRWLDRCIEELKKEGQWVLPALNQIKNICCLYAENPPNQATSHGAQRTPAVMYRHEIINKLQSSHALVIVVADNLTGYMDWVRRTQPRKVIEGDPADFFPDGRYNHVMQVQERLSFLRFLLKDGQLWLCAPQAKQIWNCLAENAVFAQDREACFKWFSKLMGEEPDLDPEINRDFFENNILQLDPALMTESGIRCFDRFFKAVNSKENKLIIKRRAFLMDDLELIGMDYIWRLVNSSPDEIASRAIDLLKDTWTNLGPRLQANQVEIHEDFVGSCFDRLRASYDTVTVIERDKKDRARLQQELVRLCRVLQVLREYIAECDCDYGEERLFPPLFRACRGKQLALTVRFPNQGRQFEDLELWTHTNDTLGAIRRQVVQRLKVSPAGVRLELFLNGDVLDVADDRKTLAALPQIKDKAVLTGKLTPVGSGGNSGGGNLVSSPESSSDSSTSSPRHHHYSEGGNGLASAGPNLEAERGLPGVIISNQPSFCMFLLQLADLGCSLRHPALTDSARTVLKLIPADRQTVERLKTTSQENGMSKKSASQIWDGIFCPSSPSQTLYNLEIAYSVLMPGASIIVDKTHEFQLAFCKARGIPAIMNMLTKNNFLSKADISTRRSAYTVLFKICKLMLTTAGYSLVHTVAEALQPESAISVTTATHNQAVILQQAMHQIPNPVQENLVRNYATRLAPQLLEMGTHPLPDQTVITSIVRLAWASAGGSINMVNGTTDELHSRVKNIDSVEEEDVNLCCEAMEVLTIAIALHPQALENLNKDKSWHNFIIDLTLISKVRAIRQTSAEQFALIATKCSGDHNSLRFFTNLLFTVLGTLVNEKAAQCSEYFALLYRLLSFSSASNGSVPNGDALLKNELQWLRRVRESVLHSGETGCEEALLEGHLVVFRELLAFVSAEHKFEIGSKQGPGAPNMVRALVDEFLFPASRMSATFRETGEIPMSQGNPVCSTPQSISAAFDLIVGLCTGCSPNLKVVAQMLLDMFFTDKDDVVHEWEYLPPVGPRPENGFVGLKNAGATCYMNSVLQQLFMIEGVRAGVLAADGACTDPDEDFSGEEREDELNDNDLVDDTENRREYNICILKQVQAIFAHLARTKLQFYVPRGLWKHFRMMQGEPVNLREQQDAVEFFMRLIDLVDEALKALGYEQKLAQVLGGAFSDQKICKTCPHRYSREQPFSVVSVDVKNFSNLTDSLHEYVKGELLDGSNAYYCERCDKKVDTIKRLCVKKLPPILVIQLKRFDYDYERECAIKFNDYFEFPRELDMEPYTVAGLAKIEGEAIDCDPSDLDGSEARNYHLRGMVVHSGQASGGHYYSYIHCKDRGWFKFDDGDVTEAKMDEDEELKAQCYGGEYMSEVFDPMLKRMSFRKQKRWWNAYMLFYTRSDLAGDDGTKPASVAAQLTKLRRLDEDKQKVPPATAARPGSSAGSSSSNKLIIPHPIEKSIQKQNVNFLHQRNQFSPEFFQFMRKIISCNGAFVSQHLQQMQQQQQQQQGAGDESGPQQQRTIKQLPPDAEDISMVSVQLASKFLFSVGFRTKKSLRGAAQEWYEILTQYMRGSKQVRLWFCQKVLFAHPSRFCEYILESPSAEVRTAFVRIIVFVAHFSLDDGPCPTPAFLQQHYQHQQQQNSEAAAAALATGSKCLSDHLLQTVLALLWMEVSEHGRHLQQYFSLFVMYASLGVAEKAQLLRLGVPATFIQVAMDEGPGPPIKYQYAELAKLYQVVSQLVRCCDVSSKCQSAIEGQDVIKPNPYAEASCQGGEPLMPLQPTVSEHLFQRYGYLKKLIEEANAQEDTRKLLQFCCWENPTFSHAVLHELLWQIAIAYTHELRPYLDLLFHVLCMNDSWQTIRIQKSLRGIPDEHSAREGLFDTIQRSKTHYQKRAYQCIKLLVMLFSQCPAAKQLLTTSADIRRKWSWSVEWLNEELERGRGGGGGNYNNAQSGGGGGGGSYSYNNWSPPAQSNESVNGYFLERSHSARITLEKAFELLPEDDDVEGQAEEGAAGPEGGRADGDGESEPAPASKEPADDNNPANKQQQQKQQHSPTTGQQQQGGGVSGGGSNKQQSKEKE